MNVRFLGQACTLIETKNHRLLVDPWIVGPCNVNSWYTLRKEPATKKDIPTDVDSIYISHEHQDHFQEETLKEFKKDVQIYICKFPTSRFYDAVLDLGFKNVKELNSWKSEKINDHLEITAIKNQDLMFEDSALLIKSNEGTVFCQTDCKLDFESLKRINAAKPDVAFFMYSPANWYPIVYRYPIDKKNSLSKKRKANKINAFVNYVNIIKPRYAIPYAGGILLPHKSQLEFNNPETSMFACPDEAKAAWDSSGNSGSEVLVMAADDEISTEGVHKKNAEPVFSVEKLRIAEDLWNAIGSDLESRRQNEGKATSDLPCQVIEYFNKIISENPVVRKHIDMKVQMIAEGDNGGEFYFDITKDNESDKYAQEGKIEDWNYFMKIPAHLVQKAVNNQLLWETLFLSCRWEGDRRPDQWNEHFINLLYDPDPKRIDAIYKIYDRM
jgi:UDP-MurNAc hydroxylase